MFILFECKKFKCVKLRAESEYEVRIDFSTLERDFSSVCQRV